MPLELNHCIINDAVANFLTSVDDALPPFCIALCDSSGELVYFLKMSHAVKRASAIAKAKARTAALMEISTRQLHERLLRENLTLVDFCHTNLTSIAGGVPLSLRGKTSAGIGVSGRTPEQDE